MVNTLIQAGLGGSVVNSCYLRNGMDDGILEFSKMYDKENNDIFYLFKYYGRMNWKGESPDLFIFNNASEAIDFTNKIYTFTNREDNLVDYDDHALLTEDTSPKDFKKFGLPFIHLEINYEFNFVYLSRGLGNKKVNKKTGDYIAAWRVGNFIKEMNLFAEEMQKVINS